MQSSIEGARARVLRRLALERLVSHDYLDIA